MQHNMTCARFPHSEIPGSILVLRSPRLIAESYVLHRYWLSRHPLSVPLCTFLCIDLTSNRSSTTRSVLQFWFLLEIFHRCLKLLIEILTQRTLRASFRKSTIELPRMISILIQRLLFATCLTVTQYIAPGCQSQHFFWRFFDFFWHFLRNRGKISHYKSRKCLFCHTLYFHCSILL